MCTSIHSCDHSICKAGSVHETFGFLLSHDFVSLLQNIELVVQIWIQRVIVGKNIPVDETR